MGRNMVRWLGVAVLVLGGSLAAYAGSSDTDSVSTSAFDVTLSETVRIEVGTQPLALTLLEAHLETRYFSLGTFTAKVWAITKYQVSGDVDFALGEATTALLNSGEVAIRVQIVQATGFGATGDDDTGENPVSDVTAESPYTALPVTLGQSLWNGGNTEGGSLTYHEATVNLWLDLDQLGDQAAGNILTVTVNLLVTET
jgi:hypothetical protein